tara:strand:- start:442 stop:762 length:321 start_codon:yes stop_codon:yes gene_type:complete
MEYIFLYNFATKKVIKMKFDEFNKLTELEQLQAENELVHVANLNSFLLLTNKLSIEDFVDENGLGMVMAHDLSEEPDKEQVLAIIDYFAEQDDFEKCIVLRDMYLK